MTIQTLDVQYMTNLYAIVYPGPVFHNLDLGYVKVGKVLRGYLSLLPPIEMKNHTAIFRISPPQRFKPDFQSSNSEIGFSSQNLNFLFDNFFHLFCTI